MEETITKRNWITKSEEKQIIATYERFKGEIIPYGDTSEHMYEITTVRKAGDRSLGLITIMSDYDPEQKELPRILVRHSDANGKRTFTDVWDRDYKGKIYWRFRNPAGIPAHPKKLDEQAAKVKELLDQGLGEKEITEKLGIGRATFYRLKKRFS